MPNPSRTVADCHGIVVEPFLDGVDGVGADEAVASEFAEFHRRHRKRECRLRYWLVVSSFHCNSN